MKKEVNQSSINTEKEYMKKSYQVNKADILLFKRQTKHNPCSQLKTFIQFLNSEKVDRPYRFAYVQQEPSLLPNLTLKENILLDSIPNSLSRSKDFQLQDHMAKTGNSHLNLLYQKIDLLDLFPGQVSEETQKITSLIKGLLQESEFLFLDGPENCLSHENTQDFIKAMQYQTRVKGQIVFISSPKEEQWYPLVSKLVTRGPLYEFLVTPVVGQSIKDKYVTTQEEKSSLNFKNPFQEKNKESA